MEGIMRNDIKIVIIVVSCILILIFILFAMGRKVNVNTDRQVEGLDQELQEILYLAALAPSSHNIQGWKTKVDPKNSLITIEADRSRALSVVDPKNRELFISLGCYTETLLYAFMTFGYDAAFSYDDENHRCVVNYSKTAGERDDNAIELIKRRHTDKSPFIVGKRIDDSVEHDISGQIPCVEFYPAGCDEYNDIKSATFEAYEAQAYNGEAAEELSKWLRLSDKEAKETKDGLPAEQLNIYGIKKVLYYLFTDHESAKGESFAKQGIETCQKQLESSAGFAVVYGDNNEAALVECGRDTVKLWLSLTEQGISVHPMSYALEEDRMKQELKTDLNTDSDPQMILRIGYVNDYGENNGIRRDLANYVSIVSSDL
jgi:hypothetical protein